MWMFWIISIPLSHMVCASIFLAVVCFLLLLEAVWPLGYLFVCDDPRLGFAALQTCLGQYKIRLLTVLVIDLFTFNVGSNFHNSLIDFGNELVFTLFLAWYPYMYCISQGVIIGFDKSEISVYTLHSSILGILFDNSVVL
jgi:hypothetical protein